MRADIRNSEGGAELRDEQAGRENRVMPATVAPAEYVDAFALELAQRDRATIMLFACEALIFYPAHDPTHVVS